MRGGGDNQIWVTSALTNDQARNALVLGCSLKRAWTSRKVAVIVSPKVERGLRRKLYRVFNQVISTEDNDHDHKSNISLTEEDSAKLTSIMAFESFERVVYLSPNMVVVRNPDGIFEQEGAEQGGNFVLSQDGALRILLFKPALNLYEEIVKGLEQQKKVGSVVDLRLLLEMWMGNRSKSKCQTLDGKYAKSLRIDSILLGNEKDIVLVDLGSVDPFQNALNLGEFDIIGKLVLQYWQKIYKEDVKPIIENEPLNLSPILKSPGRYENEPIAIVGMSCRFPGSNNLEEFWNLLFTAKDGTSTPPPFRWLREQSTVTNPEYRKTNAGFLSVPVDEFDSKFFAVSPKEVPFIDPQHRLLTELVWEGLEDACINPQELRGTPGSLFIGSWTNDYKDILNNSGNTDFLRSYIGNFVGAAVARISQSLGIVGPSMATQTACSSAMVAVHSACRSLQNGESNMALACGVNLLLNPFDQEELSAVVSPDGRCKTFCEKADGYGRAEGCGVVVLKRLSDAVADNDKIWALVRGSGMAQDGISKSIGTPSVQCESLAMTGALRDAGVGPEEVSYVEAHGSGTVVGDPMEVAAIAKAYHSDLREEPLLIGSVKTNVGHTESCAGIVGLIKVVLALHHGIIPAHRNFVKLNPAIDLEAVPARIPLEPVEWKRKTGSARMAGVSSFGFTGAKVHLILEESLQFSMKTLVEFEEDSGRPIHLLKLSAKTSEALDMLLEKYQAKLSTSEELLEEIAYSGNVGRANFNHRIAIIAKSKEELVACVKQQKFLRGEVPSENSGKICFLFTGQGSQYPGMAQQLYETSPVFRMHFDLCERILKESYSIDIKQALWGAEISRTIYSQTSIFCVEYALLKLWESWGVRPDFVLGHSLGEFPAAVCAGILKVEEALKLVAERSLLIDKLPRGKMLVVKASKEQVSVLLQQFGQELDYAAENSTEQTLLSGDVKTVIEFSKFCTRRGVRPVDLEATHAFHSRHMDPILEKYERIASTVGRGDGNSCKFISGMLGDLTPASRVNAEYWRRHTRDQVAFLDASRRAVQLGCTIFIEVGPQPILSALTMLNNDLDLTCLPSLKKTEDDWETILNSLGQLYLKGLPIDWQGFDQFYARRKVRLPSYPFIGRKFWPDLDLDVDLMAVSGATIHPLLGKCIPNPSGTKLFKSGLNLTSHEYVKDHKIGENIIVPGAAFLEMCLAAGLATLGNAVDSLATPTLPMKVEDLRIQAPLSLRESRTTQCQTIVELNNLSPGPSNWNDVKVQIFQRMQDEQSSSPSWQSHAKANFSTLLNPEDWQIPSNISDFRRTLQLDDTHDEFVHLREKLAATGLKYGPSFERLERVWKNEVDSTFLAKVSAPPQIEGEPGDHILHPTLLDAMIQSIMFSTLSIHSLKKKLFVPIRIGKFVWFARNETDETYIYTYDKEKGRRENELSFSTRVSLLLNGNGKVLAIMSEVDLIDSTVKTIEAVLEHQTTSLPELWEEVWRGKIGPDQLRQNLQLCNGERFYDEDFKQKMLTVHNCLDEEQNNILIGLERIVFCYMLQSLYELGWGPPSLGTIFSGSGLAEELGIRPQHLQYFGYILQVLEDEGILKKKGSSSSDKWQIVAKPPTREQLASDLGEKGWGDLRREFESTMLLSNIGESLGEILTDKRSALQFLFPSEAKSETPTVSSFYTEYGTFLNLPEVSKQICTKFLAYWKHKQEKTGNKFVVRILEIGGGTGMFTRQLLNGLEEPKSSLSTPSPTSPPRSSLPHRNCLRNTRIRCGSNRLTLSRIPFPRDLSRVTMTTCVPLTSSTLQRTFASR